MAAGKSGRWERWAILFSILLGFALRLFLLNRFPLREDEAIYGYWSLHFLHEDPWFLSVWPDKPPIFIWLLSGAFSLFGASPASGRMLNILISTLTIPLVGIIAQRLWGARSGWIAGWAMALSPFAISFAPTLFTDPLLVLAGSLAFYCALTRRPFWAGIWLATAIMTKQQGVLYVPLVFFLGGMGRWGGGEKGGKGERGKGSNITLSPCHRPMYGIGVTLSHFLLGVLLITLPILFWDSQRWSVAPSPWDWSMRNYAPLRFVPPGEWVPRARQWGDLLWYLAANWWVWGLLVLMLLVKGVCWLRVCAFHSAPTSPCHLITLSPCHLVTLWSLAFIALHITTTLQIWDRYLLPLAPIIALSIAWLGKPAPIRQAQGRFRPPHPFGKLRASSAFRIPHSALLLLLMLLPAWAAANGHLPIGGDHGDYGGFDSALSSLHSEVNSSKPNPTHHAPRTTQFILYHRALGWHYQFYLYDAVRAGEVELRWYPGSVYLADNASKTPHLRKFLIEPGWSPTRDLEFHLHSRGLQFEKLAQNGNFTLFEIVQPPQPFCSWCFSSVRRLFPTLTDFAAPAMICKP